MTPQTWIQLAAKKLKKAHIPSARLDAEVLLAFSLGKNRSWLVAHSDEPIDTTSAETLLERRIQREPVAYLIGHKEFYGRDFAVSPDVLIPRPETEDLIELAKKYDLRGRILDVGTGSGCLGLTLALETNSDVVLSDISDQALTIARQNAEALGVKSTLFTRSDLLETITGEFDIIAANLPYVDVEWERSPETDYEPRLALFAADGGLALITKLLDQAPASLVSGGYVLLEADPIQHPAIIEYAAEHFMYIEALGYGLLLRAR